MSTLTETRSAALAALILVQVAMLAALMAQVQPHPPAVIPLGGMGPFLGMSLSACVAAMLLARGWAQYAMTSAAILCALVSFGPQKWIDPQISLVWPAVLTAEIAVVALAVGLAHDLRSRRA